MSKRPYDVVAAMHAIQAKLSHATDYFRTLSMNITSARSGIVYALVSSKEGDEAIIRVDVIEKQRPAIYVYTYNEQTDHPITKKVLNIFKRTEVG